MKLFWWAAKDGTKNLGDEVTSIISREMYNIEPKKCSYLGADLISTGSILGWIYERDDFVDRNRKLTVLGSGFMHPWVNVVHREYLDIRIVRGYLTKNILSRYYGKSIGVGDPGLLFSDLSDKKYDKRYKYGVIPHVSSFEKPEFYNLFSHIPDVRYIDFRTDDFELVKKEMLECEVIISQGLHGLIFSDSLLLPNVWLDNGDLHKGGEFKFYDYFSTVDRPFFKRMRSAELSEENIEKNTFLAEVDILIEIKDGIRRQFDCYFDEIRKNEAI